MKIFRLVVIFFGLCSCLLGAWVSNGPEGAKIKAVCVSPANDNIVYVATETNPVRIFRSSDGGSTWTKKGLVPSMYFYCMTIDASENLYCGTWGRVYKSVNQGTTWTFVTINDGMDAIAVHPTNPSIVVGTGTDANGSNYDMVFMKSTNAGASWTNTTLLPGGNNSGRAIAFDPSNPNIIYIGGSDQDGGTYHPRLYKSTDAGVSWNNLTVGTNAGAYMYSVAVHPTNGNIVYAGKFSDGIWRSTDAGGTWTKTSIRNGNYCLATTPANPSLVFSTGGNMVYRSTNAGVTWDSLTNGLGIGIYYDLGISQTNAAKCYTGSISSFYRTTNTGTNWTRSITNLYGGTIKALGVAPSAPAVMYTELEGMGIFKTTNCGNGWNLYPVTWSCGPMCAFVVHRTDPNTVYTMEGSG